MAKSSGIDKEIQNSKIMIVKVSLKSIIGGLVARSWQYNRTLRMAMQGSRISEVKPLSHVLQ